jgi:hypothetical protein
MKFKTLKPFNRCAPFNPPPLSSPATRGRISGGGLSYLNGLPSMNSGPELVEGNVLNEFFA